MALDRFATEELPVCSREGETHENEQSVVGRGLQNR